MNEYEEKLKEFIKHNNIQATHISFKESCHSVEDASSAAKISTDIIVKNICMIDSSKNAIIAIVKGKDRVSTSRVGKALNIERPRTAQPEEILELTGYPCGGTPSFGYSSTFLIDPKVMENEIVYTGGGSTKALVKISTLELKRASNAKIVRIRK